MHKPSAIFKACAKARAFSEKDENIVRVERMFEIQRHEAPPIGYIKGYTNYVGEDVRLVYSIEEHPQKNGTLMLMRHLSVSFQPMPSLTEAQSILNMIFKCLGFDPHGEMKTFIEDTGSRGKAGNFVQPVEFGESLMYEVSKCSASDLLEKMI